MPKMAQLGICTVELDLRLAGGSGSQNSLHPLMTPGFKPGLLRRFRADCEAKS